MQQGEAKACLEAGLMYYSGRGVSQDFAKGATYFKKACDGGEWMGCGFLASHLGSHDNNESKARQYYKKACKLGEDDSDMQNDPKRREIWRGCCILSEN